MQENTRRPNIRLHAGLMTYAEKAPQEDWVSSADASSIYPREKVQSRPPTSGEQDSFLLAKASLTTNRKSPFHLGGKVQAA